jgi:hypothetical protein
MEVRSSLHTQSHPHVTATSAAITYEPLDEADDPDVVLVRFTAAL